MSVKLSSQSKKNATPASTFMPTRSNLLQQKCTCGGTPGPSGKCAECRRKRLTGQHLPIVQAKLKIGKPNDKYEQEAERIASAVMRMPEPKVQRQNVLDEEEEDKKTIQSKMLAKQITPLVQRQPELGNSIEKEEGEALRAKSFVQQRFESGNLEEEEQHSTIQLKAHLSQPPKVNPTLETRINTLRGSGQPLDTTTRVFMETRFGHDFSQVRMHVNSRATETAQKLNAYAFTVGQDIIFGAGQYEPETSKGKQLLAHELVHVMQQNISYPRQRIQTKPNPWAKKRQLPLWVRKAIRKNRQLGHKVTPGLLVKLLKISGDKKHYNLALKSGADISPAFVYLVRSAQRKLFPKKRERSEHDGILGNKTINRGEDALKQGWVSSIIDWVVKAFSGEKDPKKAAIKYLDKQEGKGKYDFETKINGARIVVGSNAWKNARENKKTIKQVIEGVHPSGFQIIQDMVTEFRIKEIQVSSLLRVTFGRVHIMGRGIDIKKIMLHDGHEVKFKNSDPYSSEPPIARKFREWLRKHPRTSQVIGPW